MFNETPARLQTDQFAGGGKTTELPDTMVGGSAGGLQEVEHSEIPPNLKRRSWDTEDNLDELLPVS